MEFALGVMTCANTVHFNLLEFIHSEFFPKTLIPGISTCNNYIQNILLYHKLDNTFNY